MVVLWLALVAAAEAIKACAACGDQSVSFPEPHRPALPHLRLHGGTFASWGASVDVFLFNPLMFVVGLWAAGTLALQVLAARKVELGLSRGQRRLVWIAILAAVGQLGVPDGL